MSTLRRGSRHNLTRDEWRAAPHAYVKRGEELPHTKLTDADVIEILEAAERRTRLRKEITDTLSDEALAKQYGVSARAIHRAIHYETHRHVTGGKKRTTS